jgi:hypothetical protein
MKIREALEAEHSKAQTSHITAYIGDDRERFKQLMKCMLEGDQVLSQRAAWAMSECGIQYPALVKPYMKQLIGKLKEPGIHDAVKRNIVRVWAETKIPDDLSGEVYDICYAYLRAPDEPLGVKAFSITVLQNICLQYPELWDELKITLEEMLQFGAPSTTSRIRKALKASRNR